uniref:Protein ZIP4 homolog n=1 Tax=Pyxicephalus adspersus TaxID=30357 RepID=A0AAV3AC65_PYXAD|nr:TPA: hypothetical protein GDO54_018353 [Pyxicephalus adspersus]
MAEDVINEMERAIALNVVSAMGKMAAQKDGETLILNNQYSATDLLGRAAQIAMENNQQNVAVKALLCVIEQSLDIQQVFMSLRCLMRLTLHQERPEDKDKRVLNSENLMSYLNIAYKKLTENLTWDGLHEKRMEEAQWLRKVAWNVAVGAQESPSIMRDCLLLSYKISLFCPCDKIVMVAQSSCLFMAAAVDLLLARTAVDHSEQVKLLVQSLENINICREIQNNLKAAGDFPNDTKETLLLLYEFEIRAKLNDGMLENMLESVWEMPNLDAKILESIASLSMEAPAYYPSICKKALHGALSLHRKQDPPDVSRLSKCLHSLVKLSLPERLAELEDCQQEEAWGYYQEALSFISNAEGYPEIEILWLMTRAWNTGVFLYSLKRLPDAGRWFALAMRLLNHLESLKSSYESKMVALYSNILDKLDKAALSDE